MPTQVFYDNNSKNEPTLTTAEILLTTVEATDVAVQSFCRIQQRPTWITDYEGTEIKDIITHFALFSYCDPTTFKSAIK